MSSTPTSAPTSAEGQTVPTAAPTVTIQSMNFAPAHIEVKVGQTVTWVNQDQVPHTVTSDTGEFDSGQMANGASFSFTFSEAGTYHYHCQLHPAMTGQITVTQ
ncbi:MAG TPA: cupredoxin family copper-binding protein [Patescibacteria group bacterium]